MPLIVIQDDNLYLNTGELNDVNYDNYYIFKSEVQNTDPKSHVCEDL